MLVRQAIQAGFNRLIVSDIYALMDISGNRCGRSDYLSRHSEATTYFRLE